MGTSIKAHLHVSQYPYTMPIYTHWILQLYTHWILQLYSIYIPIGYCRCHWIVPLDTAAVPTGYCHWRISIGYSTSISHTGHNPCFYTSYKLVILAIIIWKGEGGSRTCIFMGVDLVGS